MIHVLALLAKAGHGKTTIANYLKREYGVQVVSLAAPLKKIAQAAMGFSDAQLYGTQEQKEAPAFIDAAAWEAWLEGPDCGGDPVPTSTRVFLQKLGTEGIRKNLGETVWLEALIHNIRKDYHERRAGDDAVYVVDDARFINEVKFIQALTNRREAIGSPYFFGSAIKLICTDAPPSGNDNHPSEREVDLIPPTLIDGTAVSSLALGTAHLIGQVEEVLSRANLSNLRGALTRTRLARAAADRGAERDRRAADRSADRDKIAREALDRVVTSMRERTSGG